MKNSEVFTREIIVKKEDIDDLGHVNNTVYLQWVQQIATEHWRSRTTEALQKTLIWVVLSHYIAYKNPAFLNDRLTIKTYVGDTSGVRSYRFVEIFREGVLLASAKTEWCLLDARTMRPKRIAPELMELFIVNEEL